MQKLKYAVVAIAIVASYLFGYTRAQVAGDLELEKLKQENSLAVISAQENAKVKYEKQMQDLIVAHAAERDHYAERLRELESFSRAGQDLESCGRDRSRLARLAVRGEELLKRADNYLEALK
ncbi:MAG TPA: hypothetical protein IAC66_07655 [Candidatus Aphodousia gallistercoris]|nr:hypothetical protein [Candidatus Aphodousia gallistercoris]